MAKYRKSFELDLKDLDMIEEALRKQITLGTVNSDARQGLGRLSEIQSLLGKLHQQKIFYSEVNIGHYPRG